MREPSLSLTRLGSVSLSCSKLRNKAYLFPNQNKSLDVQFDTNTEKSRASLGLLKERKGHLVLASASCKWLMNQEKLTGRGVNQHRAKWSRCQKAGQIGNLLRCLWRIFPEKAQSSVTTNKSNGNSSTDLLGRTVCRPTGHTQKHLSSHACWSC